MKPKKEESLLQWCNKMTDEGHILKFTWEGGNDDGSAEFFIDDEVSQDEHAEKLIDLCYKELAYGSWAGNFFASGEAFYNKTLGAFVGVDEYTEDEQVTTSCNIILSVPENIWFNNVAISFGIERQCKVILEVKNGYKIKEHIAAEVVIETSLLNQLDEYEKDGRCTVDNLNIPFTDFKNKKEKNTTIIKEISQEQTTRSEKEIFINIKPKKHVISKS